MMQLKTNGKPLADQKMIIQYTRYSSHGGYYQDTYSKVKFAFDEIYNEY